MNKNKFEHLNKLVEKSGAENLSFKKSKWEHLSKMTEQESVEPPPIPKEPTKQDTNQTIKSQPYKKDSHSQVDKNYYSNSSSNQNDYSKKPEIKSIKISYEKNFIEREIKRTSRNFLMSNFILLLACLYFYFQLEISNVLVISSAFLVVANFIYYFKLNNDFTLHPLYMELSKYGSPLQLKDEIHNEFKTGQEKINGAVVLTNNWLFVQSFFSTKIINLDDLIWIYSKVTTHKRNFIETHKTHEIILNNRHGQSDSISMNSLEVEKVFFEILKRLPWLVAGYKDDLRNAWSQSNKEMCNYVLNNRQIFVPNKPLRNKARLNKAPLIALPSMRLGSSIALGFLISFMIDPVTVQPKPSSQNNQAYISTELREFTEKIMLTEVAQQTLFNSNPEFISDKSSLNKRCGNSHQIGFKNTIFFGCYDGRNIYVLNVTDSRFPGMVETITSHELLHAIYKDLDQEYKEKINSLLLETYHRITDQEILNRLKLYKESALLSELHSTIGTEVKNIPEELEEHYSKYFKNRKIILKFAKDSNRVMNIGKSAIALHINKLKELNSELKSLHESLDVRKKHISNLKDIINELSSDHRGFARSQTIEEYNEEINTFNSERAAYNNIASTYNSTLKKIKSLISDQEALFSEIFVPSEYSDQSQYI